MVDTEVVMAVDTEVDMEKWVAVTKVLHIKQFLKVFYTRFDMFRPL